MLRYQTEPSIFLSLGFLMEIVTRRHKTVSNPTKQLLICKSITSPSHPPNSEKWSHPLTKEGVRVIPPLVGLPHPPQQRSDGVRPAYGLPLCWGGGVATHSPPSFFSFVHSFFLFHFFFTIYFSFLFSMRQAEMVLLYM